MHMKTLTAYLFILQVNTGITQWDQLTAKLNFKIRKSQPSKKNHLRNKEFEQKYIWNLRAIKNTVRNIVTNSKHLRVVHHAEGWDCNDKMCSVSFTFGNHTESKNRSHSDVTSSILLQSSKLGNSVHFEYENRPFSSC